MKSAILKCGCKQQKIVLIFALLICTFPLRADGDIIPLGYIGEVIALILIGIFSLLFAGHSLIWMFKKWYTNKKALSRSLFVRTTFMFLLPVVLFVFGHNDYLDSNIRKLSLLVAGLYMLFFMAYLSQSRKGVSNNKTDNI
jgi:hypothetical protein